MRENRCKPYEPQTFLDRLHAFLTQVAVFAAVCITLFIIFAGDERGDFIHFPEGPDWNVTVSLCSGPPAREIEPTDAFRLNNLHCLFSLNINGFTEYRGLLAPTRVEYTRSIFLDSVGFAPIPFDEDAIARLEEYMRQWGLSYESIYMLSEVEKDQIRTFLRKHYSNREGFAEFFPAHDPDPLSDGVVGQAVLVWGYVANAVLFLSIAIIISFIMRPMFASPAAEAHEG